MKPAAAVFSAPGFAPAVYAALAVAWTWPAAWSSDWVGRHSDTLGTIWVIDAAGRLLASGLHDSLTGWPTGVSYLRPDSFTLLPIAALFSWVGDGRLHAWLQIVGLVVTAWAAESCARTMGAARPASLLAGLAFAFGGLGSTTLLEGHVYHLLDPWMPLAAAGLWRALGAEGRVRDGVQAGVAGLLALLTTAYLGIATALLLGLLAVTRLAERRAWPSWRPLLAAAGVYLPVAGAYAALFAYGAGPWSSAPQGNITVGATLLNLLGPTDITDQVYHSQVIAIPATVLALALTAPVVLRRRDDWRSIAACALACLVAAMGPRLDLAPGQDGLAMPMALLDAVPGFGYLHFPARLGWAWALCMGILAARVAGELPRRAGFVLAGLLAVDLFGVLGMPLRQVTQPSAIPSAYAASPGPVLDLAPTDLTHTRALDLQEMTLFCAYQSVHHRAIADVCITTSPWTGPRAELNRWLYTRALAGAELGQPLAELGFATVMFHDDLFRPQDRALFAAALADLDPEPVVSSDGGEHVVAYRVPAGDAHDPAGAWTRWVNRTYQ